MPMAIKFGRARIHNQELPSIKVQDPFITCSYKVSSNIRSFVSVYHKANCHQTLQSSGLLWQVSTHKFTQPSEQVVTWGHVIIEKDYNSLTTMSMTAKPFRVVTYNEEIPWKSIWQIKYIISPLLQWQFPPNLAAWLHTIMSFFK